MELILIAPFIIVISCIGAAGVTCSGFSSKVCSPYNISIHVPVAIIGGVASIMCIAFLVVLFNRIGSMKYARCDCGNCDCCG